MYPYSGEAAATHRSCLINPTAGVAVPSEPNLWVCLHCALESQTILQGCALLYQRFGFNARDVDALSLARLATRLRGG